MWMVWISRALTKGLLHGTRRRHEAKTNLGKLVESHRLVLKRFLQPNSDCRLLETSSVRTFPSKAGTQIEPHLSTLLRLIGFQVIVIQLESIC